MVDITKYTFSQGVQTNADDLLAAPRTILVTDVVETDNAKQPLAVCYEGDAGKPFLPCLTMRKLIAAIWGAESDKWRNQYMTLYRDPTVKMGPDDVGGVRISHMTGIDKTVSVMLLEKRGKRKTYTIFPLVVKTKSDESPPAVNTTALDAEFDASKTMTGDDKKAWWAGKTADEREYLKELAAAQP